jgi:hypothetical protein
MLQLAINLDGQYPAIVTLAEFCAYVGLIASDELWAYEPVSWQRGAIETAAYEAIGCQLLAKWGERLWIDLRVIEAVRFSRGRVVVLDRAAVAHAVREQAR